MSYMSICLMLVCISFLLFIVYNSVALGLFGVPWSMSGTYYLYEGKKKGLGWLFTIYMWLMTFTMAPGWLAVSDAVGPWMSYFTFLAFFAIAGFAFVGGAPRYKDGLEGSVHMNAAKICAAAALLWDFLVCWQIWWVPILGAVIPAIIATATRTWKQGRDYWLEMLAIDATFATIITELVLQVCAGA